MDEKGEASKQVIRKGIVYGNVTTSFGRKREEDGHTHQWTVYVRPYNNEDMSMWVKKVTFTLHETFSNQIRQITQPPYEVTETGWGEFDILINIYFNDPSFDKPVTLSHHLKLFPGKNEFQKSKNTLVSEVYDEIVFVDPPPMLQQVLNTTRPLVLGAYKHETDFDEVRERQEKALAEVQKKLDDEIKFLRARMRLSESSMNTVRTVLANCESGRGKGGKDANAHRQHNN